MQYEVIERLLAVYPNLKHLPKYNHMKKGDWFLLETNPRPSSVEDAKMIASDLINRIPIYENFEGKLYHDSDCSHIHKLDAEIEIAIENIKYRKFKIAIWDNPTSLLNYQPVVISLDPEINLFTLPDHPHINSGNIILLDSLCYTDKPEDLGKDPFNRIVNAIDIVNTWLFKHLIWIESRKKGNGIWIGPGIGLQATQQFLFYRNPDGFCRCGSKKSYKDCHLIYDFKLCYNLMPPYSQSHLDNIPYLKANGDFDIEKYTKEFKLKDHEQKKMIYDLKRQT